MAARYACGKRNTIPTVASVPPAMTEVASNRKGSGHEGNARDEQHDPRDGNAQTGGPVRGGRTVNLHCVAITPDHQTDGKWRQARRANQG